MIDLIARKSCSCCKSCLIRMLSLPGPSVHFRRVMARAGFNEHRPTFFAKIVLVVFDQ